MGFKFLFITLGGQHATGYGLSDAARARWPSARSRATSSCSGASGRTGADIPTRSHHLFSGVPYHHLVGKEYDAARLGREFVEDLPADKVV